MIIDTSRKSYRGVTDERGTLSASHNDVLQYRVTVSRYTQKADNTTSPFFE